jgi:hypothetical protein
VSVWVSENGDVSSVCAIFDVAFFTAGIRLSLAIQCVSQYFLPKYAAFLATGLGMLLLLLVLPGGLAQLIYTTRDRVLRRIAERREIVVPSLVADVRSDAT